MVFNRSSPTAQAWAKTYADVLGSRTALAIRSFLNVESTVAAHVFLQLLVSRDLPDSDLLSRWARGHRALTGLDTYTWGSKQKGAKFAALAADPAVLTALQGAVARGSDVTLNMLGVLALDGSADSIDALLPHLDPALVAGDVRLDLIKRLRKYAAQTPAIQSILREVDATLAQRTAASPALALPPLIGLGRLPLFWFDVWVSTLLLNANHVPVIQGSIHVDCRSSTWFRVSLSRVDPHTFSGPRTAFTADTQTTDELGVGRCDADGLPIWLATAATTLGMRLDLGNPRTNLRGTKRLRLMAWLHGN